MNITTGKVIKPHTVTVHGTEGVGKSTFAANAPRPIFLQTEDGTEHLDVARYDVARSWEQLVANAQEILTEKHDFQTCVLDTADHAEPLAWEHVIKIRPPNKFKDTPVFAKPSIDDYGFAKGQASAIDHCWRPLLSIFEQMREKRGMNVIILAHTGVKNFKNPEGENYDRYELKLHKDLSSLIKEWSKTVLFATQTTFAVKLQGEKKAKAGGDCARVLRTEKRPAFDAKNRFGLPFEIPLEWAEFDRLARAGEMPEALVARIRAIEYASEELKAKAERGIEQFSGNAEQLRRFYNFMLQSAA
jgi:hypothetical protein